MTRFDPRWWRDRTVFTIWGGKISKPPNITLWPAGVKLSGAIKAKICPSLLRSTHTFTQSSAAASTPLAIMSPVEFTTERARKINSSNAVVRWFSRIRLEGITGFNHDADTWFGLDPGDDAIDPGGSKAAKAGSQCMPAVDSNRNKPQNALAGNHFGPLDYFGAEALDQIPPRGRVGESRQFTNFGDFGRDIGSWRTTCERDFTTRGGEISKPPKITLWPAGVNTCRLLRPSSSPIKAKICPSLLRRSTHTFTHSSAAASTPLAIMSPLELTTERAARSN